MSVITAKVDPYKYIILGLLILGAICLMLPTLMEPWGGDQAGFGHVAKGMLDGKIPYKEQYSLTGYGIFFTYALFFKLFGSKMVAIHIGHMVVTLISLSLLFLLAYRLYGKSAAIIAALSYILYANGSAFSGFGYENKSAWGTYWYLSQREVFMAPLIMGAVFLYTIRDKRERGFVYLISGILIGLAAFYKLTAFLALIFFLAFVAIEEWMDKGPYNLRNVIRRIGYILSGFVLVQTPFLLYFWVHDALREMYQALFIHVSVYASLSRGLRIETLFSGHYSILSENLVLWLFAFISCLYIIFKDRTRNNVLIVLWALSSLLMVWCQGKFFGYHFILITPPFAVLSGYGLPRFFGPLSEIKGFLNHILKNIRKTFMLTTLCMCLVGYGIANYDYYRWHAMYAIGAISQDTYYSVFNEFPTHPYSFRSDYEIVKYLKDNGRKGDELGVVFSAGDTVIHFLSGMEPATRFVQSWYLFPADDVLAKHKITMNLRKEFIDQLIMSAPRYILCVHIPLHELIKNPFVKEDPNVKTLNEFIQNNYRMKTFPDNRFLFIRL